MCTCSWGGQKRVSDHLDLELQVVSCPVRLLRNEPSSSARVADTFNHWTISPAHLAFLIICSWSCAFGSFGPQKPVWFVWEIILNWCVKIRVWEDTLGKERARAQRPVWGNWFSWVKLKSLGRGRCIYLMNHLAGPLFLKTRSSCRSRLVPNSVLSPGL